MSEQYEPSQGPNGGDPDGIATPAVPVDDEALNAAADLAAEETFAAEDDDVTPEPEVDVTEQPSVEQTGAVAAVPAPVTPPAAPQATSPRVAQALTLLGELREQPLAAHPDTYQRIHAELQGALADIDDA